MPNLEWKATAITDLLAIIDYISDDNPDAAQVLKDEIEHKTWCDCGGRSPGANEVRYVGLMDISREENDLWNTMSVWMCR